MDSSCVRVGDTSELIAALPALLGFYPENSVVLVALCPPRDDVSEGLRIAAVMRADLEGCLDSDAAGIDAVVRMCRANNVTRVAAVVVDDALQAANGDAPPAQGVACRVFLLRLRIALLEAEIEMIGAWFTAVIRAQEYWWSFLDADHGVVADPAASPVAMLTKAVGGQRIYTSRAEIIATLEPNTAVAEAVRAHLSEASAAARRRADAATTQDPHAEIREAVELVLSHLDAAAELTPARLAEIAVALQNSRVRDCLIGLVTTSHAVAAQRLWTDLTRALPAPARADAAVLLAASAYAAGTGPIPGIALDVALAANPEHQLGRILRITVDAGLPPERVRDIAQHALADAIELGVTIPGFEQSQ